MIEDKTPMPDLVGVDGCMRGWYAVKQLGRSGTIHTEVWSSFEQLLKWAPAPAIVAVDIPIGLSSSSIRKCDVAAKALLKWPRSASVFQTPVRQTLYSTCYADACDRNRAITMKGVSRQAFNLLKKIAEVDDLLRRSTCDAARVFEVHPELAFMQLLSNQGGPYGGVSEAKRTPGGHAVRKALLAKEFGPDLDTALAARIARDAKRDDVVDAFAALWSARRIALGAEHKVPVLAEIDMVGLPMVIRY